MNQERKTYSTAWELKTPLRTLHPFPGLFYYSGFGMGHYYSLDGTVHWVSRSEARELATREGASYSCVDSLEGYQPVYLGD